MSTPNRMLPVIVACALALPLVARAADDAGAAGLRASVAVERARVPAPRFERADFIVQPTVTAATLSPDGRQVAWLQGRGNARNVWLLPTAGGAARQLPGQTEARALAWTPDSRWLLLETPRQLFALAADGQPGSGIVATLGGLAERSFAGVDPGQPASALLLEHDRARAGQPERWRLLRADMHGRARVLHADAHKITGQAFDIDGRLAYLQRVEGEALVIHRIDVRGALHPLLRCERLHRCSLLPRTDAAGRLLLRHDLDGSLSRLARVEADGTLRTLHVDPRGEADLDEVALDPVSGEPLVASYRSIASANYGLTDEARRDLEAIARRFPQRGLSIEAGHGDDAPWLLAERAASLQQVRWHLYDPRNGHVRDLRDAPPVAERDRKPARWLPEAAMARKLPVAWRASDGMRMHGFVWLPPGRDPGRLPLVTLVHGGPWNQVRPDEFGAGYSQLLANRGYVVFEPNFRASTGLGRDYLFAARGDFGNGRVQQDIVDGTRWLLAQGIGDPARVGIAGASFGGYSTLLGVTFQPDLFKVGVAIVPPPDFAWDLAWVGRSGEAANLSDRIPYPAWLRMLSLDLDDSDAMARLHAQSPLANAGKLQRPLMLVAGGEDHRVAIRGVVEYAAKLKLLGKDVGLLVDPEAGHSNDNPLAKEAAFYLLELMLHRHLGGDAPTPPDPALRDYLQRGLRIAGQDLREAGLRGMR
jgi:dienelactone hydrolase